MRSNYTNVLPLTLTHEGGYVNHPKDPGGATNRGVIQRTYDTFRRRWGLDTRSVKHITEGEVQTIYRAGYWNPIMGDQWPIGLDYVTFDASVNSGIGRGPKWSQKAVGAVADGHVGMKTIQAAMAAADKGEDNLVKTIKKACAYRLGFLKGLTNWRTFGRGWNRRVHEVEAGAIGMVAGTHVLYEEAKKSKSAARNESTGAIGGLSGGSFALSEMPEWAWYAGGAFMVLLAVVIAKRVLSAYDRAQMLKKVAAQLDALEQED